LTPSRIGIFTSRRSWSKLAVTGYVRVFNSSGELYDNAQTRLVVGTINLVEKIADLATRSCPSVELWVDPAAAP